MSDSDQSPKPKWQDMIEQARESISVALPTACAVYQMAEHEAVIVVADRRSQFGSRLVEAYGAEASVTGDGDGEELPLVVTAMSLPGWREMLGAQAPKLVARVDKKPDDMAALVMVDDENVVEVFWLPRLGISVTAPGGQA